MFNDVIEELSACKIIELENVKYKHITLKQVNLILHASVYTLPFHRDIWCVCSLTVHLLGTFFFTTNAVPSMFARLRTIRSFPAPSTHAASCLWVARTVVRAVAF